MRKGFVLFLCLVCVLCSVPVCAFAADEPGAESAVLLDADTGQVLYEKNMHRRMAPASITKILTCLIVLERADPSETVIAPADNKTNNPTGENKVVKPFDPNTTSVPINIGDQYTVADLIYAAALGSANDACDLLAYHISGTIDSFVELMNEKAREIGCADSHFANTNGLPNDDHYVSAYDMALITAYAMKRTDIRTYFGPQPNNRRTIKEKVKGTEHTFAVGNELLKSGFAYYSSAATAGKTGYTPDAGYTLVTTATLSGINVVAVVLKCDSRKETYKDTQMLFKAFSGQYKPLKITPEMFGTRTIEILDPTTNEKKADAEITLNEDVEMWVRNEIFTEDIAVRLSLSDIEYSIPDTVSASFSYAGGGTPVVTTALSVKVIPFEKENAPVENDDKKDGNELFVLIGAIAVTLLLIVLVLRLYILAEHKRRARLKRINRQKNNIMHDDYGGTD